MAPAMKFVALLVAALLACASAESEQKKARNSQALEPGMIFTICLLCFVVTIIAYTQFFHKKVGTDDERTRLVNAPY
eukprot:m.24003 g.24003  ORF g.24003 m.24003 type:complete len:77 (-) comp9499_c0_seq1:361-591(-)